MTVEEKAKAYDEALEKTRIYRDNARIAEDYVAVARYENIFPQLRESEDEKNANALIRFLNDEKVSVLMTYEARQQWLNWLERKKTPSISLNPALGFDPGSAVVYHNDESENERIIKDAIYALEEVGGYPYTVKGLKSLRLSLIGSPARSR